MDEKQPAGRVNADGEIWSFDFRMEPPVVYSWFVWNNTKTFKTVLEWGINYDYGMMNDEMSSCIASLLFARTSQAFLYFIESSPSVRLSAMKWAGIISRRNAMASTNDEDKAAAAAATEETKTEEPAGEESSEASAADATAEAAADDNKSEEAGEAEASGAAGSKRQREEPEDTSAGGGDGEISGECAE